MSTQQSGGTKTFRGRSLDELLPQVKQELGEDAVILDRRETLDGGVGGFFQRRVVELEVASGAQARAFQAELARAQAEVEGDLEGPEAHESGPPPAPAHRPHVDARVTDVTVDDLFANPRQDAGLASLFAAGRDAEPEEPRTRGLSPQSGRSPSPRLRSPSQSRISPRGGLRGLSPQSSSPRPRSCRGTPSPWPTRSPRSPSSSTTCRPCRWRRRPRRPSRARIAGSRRSSARPTWAPRPRPRSRARTPPRPRPSPPR